MSWISAIITHNPADIKNPYQSGKVEWIPTHLWENQRFVSIPVSDWQTIITWRIDDAMTLMWKYYKSQKN